MKELNTKFLTKLATIKFDSNQSYRNKGKI